MFGDFGFGWGIRRSEVLLRLHLFMFSCVNLILSAVAVVILCRLIPIRYIPSRCISRRARATAVSGFMTWAYRHSVVRGYRDYRSGLGKGDGALRRMLATYNPLSSSNLHMVSPDWPMTSACPFSKTHLNPCPHI